MNATAAPASITLRGYQHKSIERIAELLKVKKNRLLLVKATGLGKTVTFASLPLFFPKLAQYGTIVLVHRDELVFQAVEKLESINPKAVIGIEKAEYHADVRKCDIIVASVQSLGRLGSERIKKYKNWGGIIIVDEAHHIKKASTYSRILNFFGVGDSKNHWKLTPDGQQKLLVGVTATPNRNDGLALRDFFDEIAVNFDIRWGVSNGYLTDIAAFTVSTGTDISQVKTQRGDFQQGALNDAVNLNERNEIIIKAWQKHSGKRAIAFCAGVPHAHKLAEDFRNIGVSAVAVDSTTDKELRKEYIKKFRKGEIQILCNFGVFTEGFDAPETQTILMCRPTKSTPLYIQMLGRGTRPWPTLDLSSEDVNDRLELIASSPKPHMQVIDFVDNVGQHSIITAPTLFGLDPKFDAKGAPIIRDVVEKIEAYEQENPGKMFRAATDMDQVEIILSEVNVWDIVKTDEHLKKHSRYRWFEMGDGSFQIEIPANTREGDSVAFYDREAGAMRNIELGYWDKRRLYVRVYPDMLGRYRARYIYPSAWMDKQYHQERIVEGNGFESNWEEAIRKIDNWISVKYGDLANLMLHSPNWGGKTASERQINLLSKLGVPLMKDEKGRIIDPQDPAQDVLKAGKAAALISAALQMKAKKKKVA